RLQQLYRSIRDLFAQGLEGVVRDPVERRRIAIFAVATFDGIFLQWMLDPEAIDLDDLLSEIPVFIDRARRARQQEGTSWPTSPKTRSRTTATPSTKSSSTRKRTP